MCGILKLTNKYRCMHGAPPLVWNDALASDTYSTFRHATQMKHSDSYRLTAAQGGPAGENLAMGAGPTKAVQMWYSEVNDCVALPGCETGQGGKAVGHFTALVWKGTKVMACARSDSGLIACRYGSGPGSRLSSDTPNMRGSYQSNVFAQFKSESDCS
jgi:hypothetical protein